MPREDKRIFVPGLYSWGNKGDLALALSFIPWIAKIFGVRNITLTSFNPAADEPHYGYPTIEMVIRPRAAVHKYSSAVALRVPGFGVILTVFRMAYTQAVMGWLEAWAPIYQRHPALASRLVPRHVVRVAEAISTSEAVVGVPGGYLKALRFTDDLWLFHLPTFRLANALGKPAILGPCSIGPFAGGHTRFARAALQRTRLILVREDESMAIVRDLGIEQSRLLRTPDMAFKLADIEVDDDETPDIPNFRDFGHGRELVGVSVRLHSFPGHFNPKGMQRDYLRNVATALGDLASATGAGIVIVPQTSEDISIGRDLSAILEARFPEARILRLTGDYSPHELMYIYGRLRLLVGTRMHANILAMSAGTPVAAIAYEPKTRGILESMGLADWTLDIDQLDDGRLESLVRTQWDNAVDLGVIAQRRANEQKRLLDGSARQLRRLLSTTDATS